MELTPGLIVADRFRLIKPLGQGGMGAVWLGQQTALDVPCAVKFIHEEAAKSPELRTRFEREAKAAAQLRSPHVVQILDHGVWAGSPYIAMELLEGEDLEHRLVRCGALPARETLAIVVQVGRALAKAHAVGLVHRDLKPANIFLTVDEDREIAKVLDFGVAKVKETVDGSTKTGAVLGTPYYMSPEQARGSRAIDNRSDLWALAVVTYQCLTGQLPFDGEALGDLFMKIMAEPLPVPSQVATVPHAFDAWWARAAARDPAQRFQNAKEFSESLSLALGVTIIAGTDVHASGAASGGPVLAPGLGFWTPAGGSPASHPCRDSAPSVPSGSEWKAGGTPPGARLVTGAGPTPFQYAISTHTAPAAKRGGLILATVAAVLVVAGVGAFFALQSNAPASASASTSTSVASALVETAQPTESAPTAIAADTATAATAVAAASSAEAAAKPAPPESEAAAAPSADATAEPVTAGARAVEPKPGRPRMGKPTASTSPTAAPLSKPGKPNCNPPFTIDARGTKHAKPECF